MTIEILTNDDGTFTVTADSARSAPQLTFEEMLGLVAAITIPTDRKCLKWLKTPEEHERFRNYLDEKMRSHETEET